MSQIPGARSPRFSSQAKQGAGDWEVGGIQRVEVLQEGKEVGGGLGS